MPPRLPVAHPILAYERYAQEYLRSLPPEHFMEATAQARQRAITLASLALVTARRPDFHVFNELLVQYPREGQERPGQVVPDNMVVLTDKRIRASSSYNTELEPAPPFWVFEYVSKSNPRKDYEDSFAKYEQELKVPYYLVFHPENQDLKLFRLRRGRYETVKPDRQGRCAIGKLDLKVGLLDGWVHFWYQGELLPLPADLQRDLDEARRKNRELEQQLEAERQARLAVERELASLRARLGK